MQMGSVCGPLIYRMEAEAGEMYQDAAGMIPEQYYPGAVSNSAQALRGMRYQVE